MVNQARILIVDDEQAIQKMLRTVLLKEQFIHVDTVSTGEEAIEACRSKHYDFIILDVMLPGQSGFDVLPFLRMATDAPVLFLSARSSDFDKLTGFAVGGDDYMTKPFNPLEVVARVKAQLTRHMNKKQTRSKTIYDFGQFQVDEQAGELKVMGKEVACPAQVFQLLLFLCKHPNRVFSKGELYEQVWAEAPIGDDNTVMVHIHRIRERIEQNPGEPQLLLTVRGMGYKLVKRENHSDGH